MDRYSTKGNPEDIYYPKTHILINKLEIKDPILLAEVEKDLLEDTMSNYIYKINSINTLGNDFIKHIHKEFLGKLYSWAGEYRTVNISKGTTRFAVPKFISDTMAVWDKNIKKDSYLIGLDKNTFLEKLAYYKCELLSIHPFREGNGRTIRLFCDLIAMKNGFLPFEYPLENETFNDRYIKASIAGVVNADSKLMLEILVNAFRD